jgi:hypothetical protein
LSDFSAQAVFKGHGRGRGGIVVVVIVVAALGKPSGALFSLFPLRLHFCPRANPDPEQQRVVHDVVAREPLGVDFHVREEGAAQGAELDRAVRMPVAAAAVAAAASPGVEAVAAATPGVVAVAAAAVAAAGWRARIAVAAAATAAAAARPALVARVDLAHGTSACAVAVEAAAHNELHAPGQDLLVKRRERRTAWQLAPQGVPR